MLHTIPHGPKNQCKVSFIMTSAIFCRLNDAISHQQKTFLFENLSFMLIDMFKESWQSYGTIECYFDLMILLRTNIFQDKDRLMLPKLNGMYYHLMSYWILKIVFRNQIAESSVLILMECNLMAKYYLYLASRKWVKITNQVMKCPFYYIYSINGNILLYNVPPEVEHLMWLYADPPFDMTRCMEERKIFLERET